MRRICCGLMFLVALAWAAWAGGPEPSTTVVTSSLNPAPAGTALTFTAAVSGTATFPGGTVTFTDNGTVIGTVTVGTTVPPTTTTYTLAGVTLTPGTHTITATFTDVTMFHTTSAGTLTQVISGGGPGPDPGPSFQFSLLPVSVQGMAAAGATATYNLSLQNTGTGTESYALSLSGALAGTVTPNSFSLNKGESRVIQVALTVPAGATPGSMHPSTVTANSLTRIASATSSLTTTVSGAGPGPSPSPGGGGGGDTPQEVAVNLHEGWNPLGLRTRDLIGLNVPPQALGYASLVNGTYEVGGLSQASLTALGVPSRAVWVFATGNCTLIYVGRPTSSAVVPLNSGWNIVSFPSSAPLVASSIRARQNGGSAPIGSVILTTVYAISPVNNSYTPVVLTQPDALIQPGTAYWVFANSACELVYP